MSIDGYEIQYIKTEGLILKNPLPIIEVDLTKCTPEEVEEWIKYFKDAGYDLEDNE